MKRSQVAAWWAVGLAVATLSNSLALTRTGLSSYFDFLNRPGGGGGGGPGAGTEGPGGEGGEPKPPEPRPPGGDEFRRHLVDWSLRDDDWTRYSPYEPGIPGRGKAPDQTAEELGFQRLEDDNFVVFHEGDEALAKSVLEALAGAVPRMLEVYGNFPFPKFYNLRKIPVYVPKDFERFSELVRAWGFVDPNALAGFMSDVWDSGMRVYPAAMYLNPKSVGSDPDWLRKVAVHELGHHVFAVNLDYMKRLQHPAWVNEGLAEYAAQNLDRLRAMPPPPIQESLQARNNIGSESPDYWVGLSAFLVLEKTSGVATLRTVVRNLYDLPVDSAFAQAGVPLSAFDATWRERAPGVMDRIP